MRATAALLAILLAAHNGKNPWACVGWLVIAGAILLS